MLKIKTLKRNILIAFTGIILILSSIYPFSNAQAKEQNKTKTPEEIVADMTLEQKIGQMIMPAFRTWTDENGKKINVTEINDQIKKAIANYGFGGICLFGENTVGTAQTAGLVYDLQQASDIPLMISVDQEGGRVARLGTGTSMSGNMALGATGDPTNAYETASVIGSELSAIGINIDFAPDMDVNNNPSNPVIGLRSFSSVPENVAAYGSQYIDGLHSQNIGTAIKHFPGHGDTGTDSHTGLPCIDKSLEQLKECELVSFKAGINAKTDIVMTAHIQFPQIEKNTYTSILTGDKVYLPATLSKTIITDVLRNQLGFEGVVATDAMEMDAIKANFTAEDTAALAINADVDILLMPVDMSSQAGVNSMGIYIDNIVKMVRDGRIPEETITKSTERIITLKQNRGMLSKQAESKVQVMQKAQSVVGSAQNHGIEWKIAEKAITMLKNEQNTLPIQISDHERIAIFCPYENEVKAVQYAMNRMVSESKIPATASIDVIPYQNKTDINKDIDTIAKADHILAMSETSKVANMIPTDAAGGQSAFLDALITNTHAQNKKITLLSVSLPYDAARYQEADAILLAYGTRGMTKVPVAYDGETTTYGPNIPAAVCVAFGDVVPTGKVPVDIVKLDKNYQYTDQILYPVGSGITSWMNTSLKETSILKNSQ